MGMVYIILTAISASLIRSSDGLANAYTSKYKIYSIIFFILSYFSLFELIEYKILRKIYLTIFGFVICYNIMNYYNTLSDIKRDRSILIGGLKNYIKKKEDISIGFDKNANKNIEEMINKKYYVVPKYLLEKD